MTAIQKPAYWFRIGMIGLLLFSLAVRFWGLERFNGLVFDEVYYVKFAHNYLTWTPFFDGHPPLSKYLIAIGMWIGNQLPFGRDAINTVAGAAYSTWSYRWLNALLGSLVPLVVSGIAYQLTRRYSYAFLCGLLIALDGMLLVESRYALNNVHLMLFGLMGLWLLLIALNSGRPLTRSLWLIAAGIGFGASASIKWNGLWFLLGAYGMWVAAWIIRWAQTIDPQVAESELGNDRSLSHSRPFVSPLAKLTRLHWWQMGLYLGVVPAVFYFLEWIPHLILNAKQGIWQDFWTLQVQILTYHERVGSGANVHPYCSSWYSWLLMWRPVAYFYQVTEVGAPLPNGTSTLSPSPGRVIYDVHAMGNPILWWLSTAAIAIVLVALLQQWVAWVTVRTESGATADQTDYARTLLLSELWLLLLIAVNYGANLLPWTRVTRCIFLYHYMGASVFASMALAWLIDRWLKLDFHTARLLGIGMILIIGLAFGFWLPVYLGLPLSPAEFRLRMWLPSWV
jgi:dolichyl-phosphate-mannose--protein O-mannosyl transferase